ncbi:MAG: histidine kinase [Bacteroidetes bacterium]|nr:histidine kinase [Bacteroidota bacterium]
MNLIARITSFHKSNRLLTHIGFWIAALFIATATESYHSQDGWFSYNRFIYHSLTLITQIMTAYFLAYFIIPRFFNSGKYLLTGLYLVLGMYLICGLARTINIHIYEPLADIPPKAFETMGEIFGNVTRLLYVYLTRNLSIAIVFLFLKLLIDQYEAQKRSLQLEKEKTTAELNLLKAQLNPHFLFNTLNNIYSLSLSSSPAASGSIARLADILDHILYRCNGQYVPLQAEITLIKNYIELEKLRYDKRLTVNFNADVEQQTDIAPLILLSLVENAFKHGASDDTGAPEIDIKLHADEKSFTFTISNTVVKESGPDTTTSTERIGLNNLRRQLELIYGDNYRLDVSRDDKHFHVELSIKQSKVVPRHEEDQMFVG